jgi:tRNA A-37 threonylcarbamoyl transferase component Bud32
MADHMKRIACRMRTPIPGRESGRTTRLPDELLEEQVYRLSVLTAVIAGLWTLGLFVDVVLAPLVWGLTDVSRQGIAVEITGLVISFFMYGYVRFSGDSPQRKTDAGLAFLVWNAMGVAVLNTWVAPPSDAQVTHLSWATVGILVYAVIAPASPRKMLWAALIAAAMDPLALIFAYLMGEPVVSVAHGVILALPNFACAFIAALPARVLQRLGNRLREAQELGSYQLVRLLGQGGMGEVWEARHRLLARGAAIKLVRPEVLGARNDAEARVMLRRFEREAQATASLNSPHTIDVFDFGVTDEGQFYYVMELLAGRDLESLVREFGPVPAERTAFLLRQVAHSLADAHARGMVHRDIKPANIYVCRMGLEYDFVKVLDFGLVKLRERSTNATESLLTLDHTTTGTPAYMAPEIVLGDADVDSRADVYALGCVAYYLLTGQLVFEAETPMKMLMQHVHAQPVPPSQRTELPIPRELDELVLACLQKDPDLRPQSAETLLRMCDGSHVCKSWNHAAAKRWWETHLPDLTGPLTLVEADAEPPQRALAAL